MIELLPLCTFAGADVFTVISHAAKGYNAICVKTVFRPKSGSFVILLKNAQEKVIIRKQLT